MSTAERSQRRVRGDPRERVLSTAYDLFCRHGTRAVGIDRIIAESGVAKMTMYRHFPSKNDLILAVLERRGQVWTEGWVQPEVMARPTDPEGFASQWHILMKGSIVAAGEGDVDAARRARAMGELLLERELARAKS